MSQLREFFSAIETLVELGAISALAYTIEEGRILLDAARIYEQCPLRALLAKYGNCQCHAPIPCRPENCATCLLAHIRYFVFAHDPDNERWELIE